MSGLLKQVRQGVRLLWLPTKATDHQIPPFMAFSLASCIDLKQFTAPAPTFSGDLDCVFASSLSHSSDKRFLSCPCTDGLIRLFDRNTLKYLAAVHSLGPSQTAPIKGIVNSCFAVRQPYLLFTARQGSNEILVWDLRSQSVAMSLRHKFPVNAFDCNLDDTSLVVGTTSSVEIWDLQRGKIAYSWRNNHSDEITEVNFSSRSRSRFITAGLDGLVNICDFEDPEADEGVVVTFNAESSVSTASFFGLQEENLAVTTLTHSVSVWNLNPPVPSAASSAVSSDEGLLLSLKDARPSIFKKSDTGAVTPAVISRPPPMAGLASSAASSTPTSLFTQPPFSFPSSSPSIADEVIRDAALDPTDDDEVQTEAEKERDREGGYFGEPISLHTLDSTPAVSPSGTFDSLISSPSSVPSTVMSSAYSSDSPTVADYLISFHFNPSTHHLVLLSGNHDGEIQASALERDSVTPLFSLGGAHRGCDVRFVDWREDEPQMLFSTGEDGTVVLWTYK